MSTIINSKVDLRDIPLPISIATINVLEKLKEELPSLDTMSYMDIVRVAATKLDAEDWMRFIFDIGMIDGWLLKNNEQEKHESVSNDSLSEVRILLANMNSNTWGRNRDKALDILLGLKR